MDDLLSLHRVVEMHLSLRAELDDAVLERKKGVILAHADISAWNDVSTALSHDDRPDLSHFAVVYFDSEILWSGIATVFC